MKAMSEPVVLDASGVRTHSWEPFGGVHGVAQKLLWRDPRGHDYAGLLRLEAGAKVLEHAHRYAVHHVWVTTGTCRVGGRAIDAGSYAFVPAGVEHGLEGGPEGCELFYLFLAANLDD